MPKSIVWFERLAYLALFLGVANLALHWRMEVLAYSITPVVTGVSQVFTFGFQFLFIWLVARKRQNWARWVWFIVVVGGTLFAVFLAFRHVLPAGSIVSTIITFVIYVASLASGYFLLTPESRAWFRKPQP